MGLMSNLKKDRNGTIYVRLIVPKPLREVIGKTELKKSLRTKSWREANKCAPAILDELKKQIHAAEIDSAITLTDIKNAVSLWKNKQITQFQTDSEILSRYVRYEWVTNLKNNGKDGDWCIVGNNDAFELCRERSLEAQAMYSNNDPNKDFNYNLFKPKAGDELDRFMCISGVLQETMQLSKLFILTTSPKYRILLKELTDAYWEVAQTALQFKQINAYHTAKNFFPISILVPDTPDTNHESKVLSALFNEYKLANERNGDIKKHTIREYESSIRRFIELHGDLDITIIKKRHVAQLKSILKQLPCRPSKSVSSLPINQQIETAQQNNLRLLNDGTVKKLIRGLSAVLAYAVEMGLLKENPAAGIRFSPNRQTLLTSETSKNFAPDEINRIFNSAIFTHQEKPDIADYGEAHYWIPLILYYTGARVEEIAQLHSDDIQQSNSIWFIRISDERDDQSVKNDSSRREVPIHQHLIDLGFLDYKSSLPDNSRLFPRLNNRNNKYHTALAKWWSKYLKEKIGITRKVIKPYHAFRHTFITLCRDRGIREDIQNAITGHSQSNFSSSNVGRQYGDFSLEMKKEAIDKIPMLNINILDETENG